MTAASSFATETSNKYSEEIAGMAAKSFTPYDPTSEPAAPPIGSLPCNPVRMEGEDGTSWFKVTSLEQVAELLARKDLHGAKIICSHTSSGVYGADFETGTFIDISAVPALSGVEFTDTGMSVGSTVKISHLAQLLKDNADKSQSFTPLYEHIMQIASWQVRNAGSWAGNIMMARKNNFLSDLATIVMGAGATIELIEHGEIKTVTVEELLWCENPDPNCLLLKMTIPFSKPNEYMFSYRQALRYVNAHALINAAFRVTLDGDSISEACVVVNTGDAHAKCLSDVEAFLVGKALTQETLTGACELLATVELTPETQYHSTVQPEGKDGYRSAMLQTFLFKFFASLLGCTGKTVDALADVNSQAWTLARPAGSGSQQFLTKMPDDHPGSTPTTKLDARQLASGEAKYTDDMPATADTLYGCYVLASQANAKVTKIDSRMAMSMPGVVHWVDAEAAGAFFNSCSLVPFEEPIFVPVGGVTQFVGQGVAIVLAKSRREAEAAALVGAQGISYEAGTDAPIFSIQDAIAAPAEKTQGIAGEGELKKGDVDAAWVQCATVVEGEFLIGGQSHFAMEKHSVYVMPQEGDHYTIYAASQVPDFTHTFCALALGVNKDHVTIITKRCGGGFGSKITHAFKVSMGACVASKFAGVPVKMQNPIAVDMHQGGNCRHPNLFKYKAGCDANGLLLGFEIDSALDAGCANDFTGFCCGEVKENLEGVYHVPNLGVKVKPYKTNTASNTAVRAPGLIQAAVATEHIIDHVAAAHGMEASEMRTKNLMSLENAITCAGAKIPEYNIPRIVEELKAKADWEGRKAAVDAFNAEHKWKKRGIEFAPIRYSCTHSFGAGTSALVNISASDGSVTCYHSGVEIGQGIDCKAAHTIAKRFGVDIGKVTVRETNTSVNPNCMITGGSVTSECVVKAVMNACDELLERMLPVREYMTEQEGEGFGEKGAAPTWEELCKFCSGDFMPMALHINLSCAGMYVPEGRNNLDALKSGAPQMLGHGLADYFSTGCGISEVEIDVLSGAKTIIRTDILQDCGHSLNPQIDIGQTEGAFMMGIGFMLQEEIMIDKNTGANQSFDTWEYKPCLYGDTPIEFNTELLKDAPFGADIAVRGSKAIGEPPACLAVSALSAIKSAIRASRVERGLSPEFQMNVPATVDRIHAALEIDASSYKL